MNTVHSVKKTLNWVLCGPRMFLDSAYFYISFFGSLPSLVKSNQTCVTWKLKLRIKFSNSIEILQYFFKIIRVKPLMYNSTLVLRQSGGLPKSSTVMGIWYRFSFLSSIGTDIYLILLTISVLFLLSTGTVN